MKSIPLKQWLHEQAAKASRKPNSPQKAGPMTATGIYSRLQNGDYPEVRLDRRNARVIYVEQP
jgi:hypothetical protein